MNNNDDKLHSLDFVPGWKSSVTAVMTALFNVANTFGWVPESLTPETVDAINAGLLAMIGLFIAMKVNRMAKNSKLR